MSQAEIRELLPKVRSVLRDKNSIKSCQLVRLLGLENTRAHSQLCGKVLSHLPEWKRRPKQRIYDRVDIRLTSYRLVLSLSDEQKSFLEGQKQKFGLSYASQIRSMIAQRIEINSPYMPQPGTARETTPSRTAQITKHPDAANISALNQELKTLFAHRKTHSYIG